MISRFSNKVRPYRNNPIHLLWRLLFAGERFIKLLPEMYIGYNLTKSRGRWKLLIIRYQMIMYALDTLCLNKKADGLLRAISSCLGYMQVLFWRQNGSLSVRAGAEHAHLLYTETFTIMIKQNYPPPHTHTHTYTHIHTHTSSHICVCVVCVCKRGWGGGKGLSKYWLECIVYSPTIVQSLLGDVNY